MDSSTEYMILEDELIPLVQEWLAAGQKVRDLPFRGVSMLPLLRQGKDAVELSPLPPRLKKYDLPVYRYPSGKYVMHRVVAVKDWGYVCRGDNTYKDEHITQEMMIGLVSSIRRGEKRISVDSAGYQLYSRVWCAVYPLRHFCVRAKNWLRRHLR